MQISEAAGGSPALGAEPCRFPKLEECAHFHYERVHLPQLRISLQTNMDQSLHSQHTNEEDESEWFLIQVTSGDECWLLQRNFENFKLLDAQLHQCIYDRKISQLKDLHHHSQEDVDIEVKLIGYLDRFTEIADNSVNCGPVLNWLQMDNKGHRLLVPSEESRSINTPAVAAAYSVRRYVSQARDELNLEVGDMISVIDMASPGESMWWRGKRGFQVGFFPQHCVHIIGDKVPRNMPLPPPVVGSLALTPIKPVLRKHGKLITFFRSFILNRPSRRRLKQSGILRERVFACDLGEHLLNSGHDIPMVLKCCAEFIEKNGIVDGIYRLSGVTSNIQKLRNAFDEDRIPNLYTEDILQDIHSVASLLKMYFRELPNPLCTYQLYQSFVNAVQGGGARHMEGDHERLLRMREAVQKLPPPHYRTLEYLMRHLAKVAKHGPNTGMTTRNIAIVWAPNLLRCAELEDGGVTALQGVGVQAVVTEFLICFSDLIFCDRLPNLDKPLLESSMSPKKCRPKSLAISTPTKLITLEEAQSKQLNRSEECNYIEVGGGPKNLPKKYHTIIELPSGIRKRGLTKRSPLGWRSFFTKSRNSSQGNLNKNRKSSVPGISVSEKSITESDLSDMRKKLRSVKSAESLTSGHSEPTTNEIDILGPLHSLHKPPGHNRSVSHDSYFDTLQTSRNNSEASLLDLSEIQLNFDLEETEMRIFSEDESLVSSPKVHGDGNQRRVLTRARPEEFSSTTNSGNPSPKKQARVVMSPDSMSRKRTRLEDQLSDIQYIDCNTPDNVVSTTVLVHAYPENGTVSPEIVSNRSYESYRPKNKSPRNSDILDTNKRKSLNLKLEQNVGKQSIVKSFTETDVGRRKADTYSVFGTPSPQSPRYRHLGESSANTTPGISPDSTEVTYEQLGRNDATKNSTTPTYENVLTTISIIYKSPPRSVNSSPLKSPVADPDGVYENVIFNPEKALIPTSTASLPTQQASQPELCNQNETLPIDEREQRPKSLSALEDNNNKESTTLYRPNLSSSAVYDTNEQISLLNSADSKTLSSNRSSGSNIQYTASSNSPPYRFIDNGEQTGSPTDLSLSEVLHSSTENLSTSHTSLSFPASPSKNSPSPNVSPTHLGDSKSQTPNSLLNTKNTSECSLLQDVSYSEDCCKVKENAARPISINLIDFSPVVENDRSVTSPISERHRSSPTKIVSNDKRKSSETENNDDINIYQQVKYFRRSIHEVNALLDYPSLEQCENSLISTSNEATKADDSFKDETYDSLEPDDAHVYENIEGEAMRTDCSYENVNTVRNGVKEDEAIEKESPEKKSTDSAVSADVLENISPKSEYGKLFTDQSAHKSPRKSKSTTNSIDAAISQDATTTEDSTTVEDSRKIDPTPKLSPKGSAIFEDGIALRSPKNSKDSPATFENRIELRSRKSSKDSALFEAISAVKSSRNSKDSEDKISVKDLLVKFEDNKDSMTYSLPSNTRNSNENVQPKSEPTNVRLRKFYEKDSLPPCLRARNLKNQIKTRSLDEEEFKKEFGLSPSRRKSLDESTNYKTNSLPKMLNPPKGLPLDEDDEINSIHMSHSTENLSLLPEEERKKRERIEKYKEERRKILQEKFRSESFKEGKDVILSRLKIASKPTKDETIECEADESSRYEKTRRKNSKRIDVETKEAAPPPPKQSPVVVVAAPAIAGKPPAGDLKSDSLKARAAMFEQRKMLSPSKLPQPCKAPAPTAKQTRCVTENNKADFIRNKIDDVGVQMLKNERRRHTFDSRDRELEAERSRRVSVENRSPRKEKAAPSPYCIKDMKAIFESKSKQ